MDNNQHEQYEYARRRIKQKKRLYFHLIIFFIGSIFIFFDTIFLNIGKPYIWYKWVVSLWLFIFIIHLIKVFVIDCFMNKNWERTQIDILVGRQKRKIEQLQSELDSEK